MVMCFSFLLFDVILYSFFFSCFPFFLSSLRVSNFFVFHLFKQKISSCFISSFSICSCSDSFSMSSSFFQLLPFAQKHVTPFACFVSNTFSLFLFLGLSCVLFFRCLPCFVLNISFFSSLRCPFFFQKKVTVLISFRLFSRENMITIVSILLS